jgi:hypothetical protein
MRSLWHLTATYDDNAIIPPQKAFLFNRGFVGGCTPIGTEKGM